MATRQKINGNNW